MEKVKLKYALENATYPSLIMVPKGSTVGEILEIIKTKKRQLDLNTVFTKDDGDLDLLMNFDDIWSDKKIFFFLKKNIKPPIRNQIQQMEPIQEGCIRCYISINYELMTKGIDLQINSSYEFSMFNSILSPIIANLHRFPFKTDILYFLPGGISYNSGILDQFYQQLSIRDKILYIVVVRSGIDPEIYNYDVINLCDATAEMEILLSPITDSTKCGLSQIASILGYFQHEGPNCLRFVNSLASLTLFSPAITFLLLLLKKYDLTASQLVCISSVIYSLYSSLLPQNTPPNRVLEYACKCSCYVSLISAPEVQLNLMNMWMPNVMLVPLPSPHDGREIDDINNSDSLFKAYSPYEISTICSTSILQTATGTGLVEVSTAIKPPSLCNIFKINDPFKGESFISKEILISKFENSYHYTIPDLIYPQAITQVTYFVLDASSPLDNLEQWMSCYASRIEGHRIRSLQGIVTFNNRIVNICPLTSNIEHFLDSTSLLSVDHGSKLWDAVYEAYLQLGEIRDKYPNAYFRIIVITNGTNSDESDHQPIDFVYNLINDGIVLESVLINGEVPELAAYCHITGGQSFIRTNDRVTDLFEADSFVDMSSRGAPKTIEPHQYNTDFINNLIKNMKYDLIPVNEMLENIKLKHELINPIRLEQNQNQNYPQRIKRIMRELAQVVASEKYGFVKVFPVRDEIDSWKLFLKSYNEGPYSQQWWPLLIHFPPEYPKMPPMFRFIGIPYHINISDEGLICIGALEKNYSFGMTVISMIREIINILDNPDFSSPYQIDKLLIYKNDPIKFNELVAKSVNVNSCLRFEDILRNFDVLM